MRTGVRLLIPIAWLAWCVAMPAAAADVDARLALHDGKATFVAGEPIVLDLLIESNTGSIAIDRTTADVAASIDHVAIEPSAHVYPWKADRERFAPRWGDTVSLHPPGTSFRRSLTLNGRFRFDAAGTYTVHVVTSRVRPALTTNDVTFTIVRATREEMERRVLLLDAGIRHDPECKGTRRFADALDWLADDVATEAKLRLLAGPSKSPCYFRHDVDGLWIANDRHRVIERLEEAVADPAEDLPMGSALLGVLIGLKVATDHPIATDANVPLRAPSGDVRQRQAFDAESAELAIRYAHVLATTLPRRTGRARVDGALRIMAATNGSLVPAEQDDFAAARDALIDHFEDLDEYNVGTTIDRYGAVLREPRIAPHLVKTLASPAFRQDLFSATQGLVIRLLSQVDVAAGATALARSACAERIAMFTDFDGIAVATVPQADRCLGDRLHRQVASDTDRNVAHELSYGTMPFVARFASSALVPEVERIYPSLAAMPDRRAAHAAIAYLMRWNVDAGRPLLDAASTDTSLLFDLTICAAPDAPWFRRYLRDAVGMSPVAATPGFADALGRVGVAGDEGFVADRLAVLRALPSAAPEKVRTEAAIEQALRCIGWRASGKRC